MLAVAAAWCRAEALAFHASERWHAFALRVFAAAERLGGAMFSEALSSDEKSRLTVKIYDFYPGYREVGDRLYPIEEDWFARRLPRPPARLLVGACGTGREAIALVGQGYRVDALEPAPRFVAESRRRLAGRAPVQQLSYEQLSALVLDGVPAADSLHAERFDAVLLGCGSLTHVLEPRQQRRLFEALHLLCPSGPILASFFCADEGANAPARVGRAARLGSRLGRAIARLRGLKSSASPRLSYRAHSGFAYTFSESEIEELARGIGRRVAWERQDTRPSHYATFLPPEAAP